MGAILLQNAPGINHRVPILQPHQVKLQLALRSLLVIARRPQADEAIYKAENEIASPQSGSQ